MNEKAGMAEGMAEGVGVAVWQPRDVIDIAGVEATDYLQGQISADVEALAVGASTMSFVLDPKGRVESLFRLTRLSEEHLLADTDPTYGEALKESLERFKLRTKVDFVLRQMQMLSVRSASYSASALTAFSEIQIREHVKKQISNPAALEIETLWPGVDQSGGDLSDADQSSEDQSDADQSSALPLRGFDVLADSVLADSVLEEIGTLVANASATNASTADQVQALEWLRTLYGLPVIGKEIQPGAIPNETGLLDVAVSFTKGCYRGQELVERIDSRAGARKEIYRIVAAAPPASPSEANATSEANSTAVEQLTAGASVHDQTGAEIGTMLSAVERPADLSAELVADLPAGFPADFPADFRIAGFAMLKVAAINDSDQPVSAQPVSTQPQPLNAEQTVFALPVIDGIGNSGDR